MPAMEPMTDATAKRGAGRWGLLPILRRFLPTLQAYVLREFLVAFALAFLVSGSLVFFFVIRNAWRQGLRFGMSLADVMGFAWSLAPGMLPMALGLSAFAAAAMTFARLAADNEVIAARAAGVSALRMSWPVLAAGALLASVSLADNQWGLAWAQDYFVRTANAYQVRMLDSAFQPGASREFAARNGLSVRTFCLGPRGEDPRLVMASIEPGREGRPVRQYLYSPRFEREVRGNPDESVRVTLRLEAPVFLRHESGPGGEITVFRNRPPAPAVLEQSLPQWLEEGFRLGGARMNLSITDHFRRAQETARRAAEDARPENVNMAREVAVEAHLKVALATTPAFFVLLGVPLGLAARRGSRAMALGGALAVALLAYYPFVLLAGSLGQTGALPPAACAWIGNAVLGAAGIFFFYRTVIRD
jgi:lipopolysaccharide export system permease protein